ncbi:MAG: UDP-N-acetylglucosamine--N-acetylmuramyl-(pentapeptide) pyrophosphoryl-undecaprenol N-acetylglucosamine transferase [Solirubrobacterales bacterium]
MPALAVADALRAEGADVFFLGARGRLEAELVPAAGYEVELLDVRGIDRGNPLKAIGAIARAAGAVPAARRLLRRRGAAVVMGGGGYVAGPGGLAALRLRLPLVLTEADRHLGLANRLLARRAARVCLAFEIPGLEGERFTVTGRPVPASILSADRTAARARFGIDPGRPCLLVFGGSQGARSINLAALAAFVEPAPGHSPPRDFHVLHIAGHRDFPTARERLDAAGEVPHYTLLEYEPSLADPLAACDLVLARSGGSIFEFVASGRPAILVPYPHAAADHQRLNAEWMRDAGAAEVISDEALDGPAVATMAAELLADTERLNAMARASASLARPDAAERVASEILRVVA